MVRRFRKGPRFSLAWTSGPGLGCSLQSNVLTRRCSPVGAGGQAAREYFSLGNSRGVGVEYSAFIIVGHAMTCGEEQLGYSDEERACPFLSFFVLFPFLFVLDEKVLSSLPPPPPPLPLCPMNPRYLSCPNHPRPLSVVLLLSLFLSAHPSVLFRYSVAAAVQK